MATTQFTAGPRLWLLLLCFKDQKTAICRHLDLGGEVWRVKMEGRFNWAHLVLAFDLVFVASTFEEAGSPAQDIRAVTKTTSSVRSRHRNDVIPTYLSLNGYRRSCVNPRLSLRGGKVAESQIFGLSYLPDNYTIEWDGNPDNCKCMRGCCLVNIFADELELNKLPDFDYKPDFEEKFWSYKLPSYPEDYQDEAEKLNISSLEELSEAIFENQKGVFFPRSFTRQLFISDCHINWENRTLDENTDTWLDVRIKNGEGG
eukprot:766637-Hanusia_phi.AAC.2